MIQENEKLLKERIEEYAIEMANLFEDAWETGSDETGLSFEDAQLYSSNIFNKVPLELRGAVYLEFINELKLRLIPFDNSLANLEVA